eukprot:TRINITY_DN30316_c0_g1_i1.p1 TRINITY_DN30316_c0_g1~~TRINITY_DN30316_c0_g1_i1.p1  ORF type:complete len:810 (-),score=219.23 TRINITY_DN30316_c0_g1_i1:33-2462(-)
MATESIEAHSEGSAVGVDAVLQNSCENGSGCGSTAAAPAAAPHARVGKRTSDVELRGLMDKMRERCEVLESVPAPALTDAGSRGVDASALATDTPAVSLASTASTGGAAASAAGVASAASAPSATAGAGRPAPRKLREGDDLRDWMQRMQGRCEVLESVPAPAAADARADEAAVAKPAAPNAQAKERPSLLGAGDGEDLQNWMARLRERCEVLESVPCPATADAVAAEPVAAKGGVSSAAVAATRSRFGNAGGYAVAAESGTGESNRGRACRTEGSPSHRLGGRRGLDLLAPLSRDERERVWSQLLPVSEGSASSSMMVPPALGELLSGTGGGCKEEGGEDVLFEAATPTAPGKSSLARAFCLKHLAWLGRAPEAPRGAAERRALLALAQLLRYHHPAAALALEAPCRQAGYGDLAGAFAAVCTSCGMAVSLWESMFETSEQQAEGEDGDGVSSPVNADAQAESLRFVCDIAVLEEDELLLFFLVVVLLSEIELEPGVKFAQLEDRIRGALSLGALATSADLEKVRIRAVAARELAQATPVSLRATLDATSVSVAVVGALGVPGSIGVCAVAPEEVLHHTHGTPPGEWRLIVVDARMRESSVALPVCLRLARAQHNQRRQVLKEMPEDASIHLCLLGDAAPAPGDDAYELARYLVGPGALRRHVSLVDGGWPAVERLAASLGLDLLPVEADDAPDASERVAAAAATAAVVAQRASEVAAETAVDVAGHLASATVSATEAAASAGSRMAQMAWAGAGRAWGSFLSRTATEPSAEETGKETDACNSEKTTDASASAEKQEDGAVGPVFKGQ